jgi:hypothetical protein
MLPYPACALLARFRGPDISFLLLNSFQMSQTIRPLATKRLKASLGIDITQWAGGPFFRTIVFEQGSGTAHQNHVMRAPFSLSRLYGTRVAQ